MKIKKTVTKPILVITMVIVISVVAIIVILFKSQSNSTLVKPKPLPPLEELIPQGLRTDTEVTLRVLYGEEIKETTMERYIIGVLAAEMPATFAPEALKAQAVAIRTNALYNIYVKPKSNHPDADVCTSYSCCTAYKHDEQLRDSWKDSYVENITKIINAVLETDGEYVSYEGEPILAVFHSSSAGKTEASENVWVSSLPYLSSVYSPETEENVPDYISSVTISRSDFIETVKNAYPESVLIGNEESWITDITYNESGRVRELIIGGIPIKGTALRSMFKLRSTAISFEWIQGDIVFTTKGFGHGVGMSQYGANVMAGEGVDYRDILCAYYSGTVLLEEES